MSVCALSFALGLSFFVHYFAVTFKLDCFYMVLRREWLVERSVCVVVTMGWREVQQLPSPSAVPPPLLGRKLSPTPWKIPKQIFHPL